MQIVTLCGLLCLLVIGSSQAKRCPRTKTRLQWGAVDATSSSDLKGKVTKVYIKEIGQNCFNQGTCPEKVKDVQSDDMLTQKYPDISCNFLIGSDGNVYEGRGWDNAILDQKTIVICMLGSFQRQDPDNTQVATLKTFLECSFDLDRLAPGYRVHTMRDLLPFMKNPGDNLYDVIKKLPNYVTAAKLKPDLKPRDD